MRSRWIWDVRGKRTFSLFGAVVFRHRGLTHGRRPFGPDREEGLVKRPPLR